MLDAKFGHEKCVPIIEAIEKLAKKVTSKMGNRRS